MKTTKLLLSSLFVQMLGVAMFYLWLDGASMDPSNYADPDGVRIIDGLCFVVGTILVLWPIGRFWVQDIRENFSMAQQPADPRSSSF